MRVEVLGPLAVWRDGRALPLGPVQLRAVLGLLTLHAGTGLPRTALVDALWGHAPPPSAAAMIQAQASQIRRLLDGGQAVGTGPRLSWTVPVTGSASPGSDWTWPSSAN
jgi:DNA-binding SARP family transcriptional activator